jgi:hypothetical protein
MIKPWLLQTGYYYGNKSVSTQRDPYPDSNPVGFSNPKVGIRNFGAVWSRIRLGFPFICQQQLFWSFKDTRVMEYNLGTKTNIYFFYQVQRSRRSVGPLLPGFLQGREEERLTKSTVLFMHGWFSAMRQYKIYIQLGNIKTRFILFTYRHCRVQRMGADKRTCDAF